MVLAGWIRAPVASVEITCALVSASCHIAWTIVVYGLAASVLPIVMTPLLACVFTLMYYDLRVRREAFDLEVLGRQLGIG